MFSKNWLGPLLVGIAAALWATDALFRAPTVKQLDPTFIVFAEHLIAVTVLAPWILVGRRHQALKLTLSQWTAALLIGVGGSAAATVFFTASFRYVNPSVSILLQKIQPVLVVLLAFVLLRERPSGKFYLWALLALWSGVLLSFPDLDFSFLSGAFDLRSRGVTYALVAAGLWAASTVAGKTLISGVPASVATFWRFVFGLIALGTVTLLGGSFPFGTILADPRMAQSLLYMALVPGLLSMVVYYSGLSRTSASVATFMELLFPISAVALNWYFLDAPLSDVQLGAGAMLLVSVTMISRQRAG